MSAFNELRAEATRPACGHRQMLDLQFRYGSTWQHYDRVGETLAWGRNDVGRETDGRALVEAVGGPCASCKTAMLEFAILVENGLLSEVGAVPADVSWPEDRVSRLHGPGWREA